MFANLNLLAQELGFPVATREFAERVREEGIGTLLRSDGAKETMTSEERAAARKEWVKFEAFLATPPAPVKLMYNRHRG